MPGVSSWDDVQPAPPFNPCGQSASNPSHTPRQLLSLQSGSFPTVSAEIAGGTKMAVLTARDPNAPTILLRSARRLPCCDCGSSIEFFSGVPYSTRPKVGNRKTMSGTRMSSGFLNESICYHAWR